MRRGCRISGRQHKNTLSETAALVVRPGQSWSAVGPWDTTTPRRWTILPTNQSLSNNLGLFGIELATWLDTEPNWQAQAFCCHGSNNPKLLTNPNPADINWSACHRWSAQRTSDSYRGRIWGLHSVQIWAQSPTGPSSNSGESDCQRVSSVRQHLLMRRDLHHHNPFLFFILFYFICSNYCLILNKKERTFSLLIARATPISGSFTSSLPCGKTWLLQLVHSSRTPSHVLLLWNQH